MHMLGLLGQQIRPAVVSVLKFRVAQMQPPLLKDQKDTAMFSQSISLKLKRKDFGGRIASFFSSEAELLHSLSTGSGSLGGGGGGAGITRL